VIYDVSLCSDFASLFTFNCARADMAARLGACLFFSSARDADKFKMECPIYVRRADGSSPHGAPKGFTVYRYTLSAVLKTKLSQAVFVKPGDS